MHPWPVVRIMHPADYIGRIRFNSKQFEAESSIALTIALSLAMFESSIPTGNEKIPKR